MSKYRRMLEKTLGYSDWKYNDIPDPEANLAKLIMNRGSLFKKSAEAIYRCGKCQQVLGFVYPVIMRHEKEPCTFGQFDDSGALVVNAPRITPNSDGFIYPCRPSPFGPFLTCEPLEEGYIYRTSWFFAYRRVDTHYMVVAHDGDIAEAPASQIKGLKIGSTSPDDPNVSVVGKRDVWRIADLPLWSYTERNPFPFSRENPPGFMNCEHTDATVTLNEVCTDMEHYHYRHPIALPRKDVAEN